MKILFLTQVLPYPLDAGPKTRAYYVLRHLAQSHEITLVSFVRATDTPEALAHLQRFCRRIYTMPLVRSKWRDGLHLLRSLATGKPFIMARYESAGMVALLRQVITECGPMDAVHADQLWMAPYALQAQEMAQGMRNGTVKGVARAAVLSILDQHNAVYKIPERLMEGERNWLKRALLQAETQKLARYEVDICRRFDRVVWVTREDYVAVQSQVSAADAVSGGAVPNSALIPITVEPGERLVRKRNGRRITFLGGLHYPPNAEGICWFAEHVFGRILAEAPDAILTVIGKQPPARLMQLGIPQANLEITGYVDDPRPYLGESAAFIVPLHAGGGMRVKILDGWAWGVPMVSTTVGAEGIETLPGENILIADSPDEFAQATLRLLRAPQEGERLADSGYRWVCRHYGWQTRYAMWDAVYAR